PDSSGIVPRKARPWLAGEARPVSRTTLPAWPRAAVAPCRSTPPGSAAALPARADRSGRPAVLDRPPLPPIFAPAASLILLLCPDQRGLKRIQYLRINHWDCHRWSAFLVM